MLAAGANDAGRANAETDVPGDTHGRWGWGGSDGRSRGFGRGIGIVRSGPTKTNVLWPARPWRFSGVGAGEARGAGSGSGSGSAPRLGRGE